MTNETKTDFSEWLVASDIDGTLNNKFRKLPQRNYDAIKEFVVNKKGHFTLASGRNIEQCEVLLWDCRLHQHRLLY